MKNISLNDLRTIALDLPGAFEIPHQQKTTFRSGNHVFAVYDHFRIRAYFYTGSNKQNTPSLIDSEHLYQFNINNDKDWKSISLEDITTSKLTKLTHKAYSKSKSS